MKPTHQFVFFTNSFSIGLLAPVLSLVLLSHGATLKSLSLCIGVFAVMVVILELPSGMLADLIGRKRIYLISCCFMLVTYLLILLGDHFFLLAAACACQGIGRAFSSGSIEALEIETYVKEHGDKGLSHINSTLAIIESIGLAAGSLCGGFLGYVDASYIMLLIISILLQWVLLLSVILFVKEEREHTAGFGNLMGLGNQVRLLFSSIQGSPLIAAILAVSAMIGLGLCIVEVYWQPTLKLYLPEHMEWIFGVINCLGYLGVTLGSQGASRLWNVIQTAGSRSHAMACYWLLRLLLPVSILALGLCGNLWLFLFLFVLFYAVLGAGNLFENTMFHGAVDNSQRVSMMSLSSLYLRGGGIITSVLGGLILTGGSLGLVWVLLPSVMAAGIVLIMILYSKKGMRCSRDLG